MTSLHQLLLRRQHKTLSPIEDVMVEYLCSLPEYIDFETNYAVGPYFIDIALPQHKVGMEIDVWKYHTSEEQIDHDTKRDEYLVGIKGWIIERVPAWFVSRYPDLSLLKILRHIPEMHETELYKLLYRHLIQYNIREAANEGIYLPIPDDA